LTYITISFSSSFDFGFHIADLDSRFMAFPRADKSNPAKDCSWNYYRDYSDHLSKYHPNAHCFTIGVYWSGSSLQVMLVDLHKCVVIVWNAMISVRKIQAEGDV